MPSFVNSWAITIYLSCREVGMEMKMSKGTPINSAIQRWTVAETHVSSGRNEYWKRRTQLFSFSTSFQASKIFPFKAVREKSRPLWSLMFGTKGATTFVFFWVAFHSVATVHMFGTSQLSLSYRKASESMLAHCQVPELVVPLNSRAVFIYLSPGQF